MSDSREKIDVSIGGREAARWCGAVIQDSSLELLWIHLPGMSCIEGDES